MTICLCKLFPYIRGAPKLAYTQTHLDIILHTIHPYGAHIQQMHTDDALLISMQIHAQTHTHSALPPLSHSASH